MSVLGIVGDLHEPFCHPMYRRFVHDTFEYFRVNLYHFAGDVSDGHALSYHEHNPNGLSAGDEYEISRGRIARWYSDFPSASISIGNHDELLFRKAKTHGIPEKMLRSYNEIWETPRWNWDYEHTIDGNLLTHGTGTSGKNGAINFAIQRRCSIGQGHLHSWAGVQYHANSDSIIFGMSVGCGIDPKAYTFEYGRNLVVRPVLACGIIIDGVQPFVIPMRCGRGEKYHRSRAGKKRNAS